MDYGAPVGFRLALRHPERVRGLVVQNGNAYEEGLGEFWGPIKAYWADGSAQHRAALHPFVEARATREQYETACATGASSIPPRGSWTRSGWIGRATARSRWTSSTITAPTWRFIRASRPSSGSTSRRP